MARKLMTKNSKPLKIGKKIIGAILYDPNDSEISWVEKQIYVSFRELQNIFRKDIPKIVFELIYSRSEFDRIVKKKTPDWIVGLASRKKIRVASPSVISQVSAGMHNKSGLAKIIKHEICHLFNHKISPKPLRWTDEGIALFFAKQKKNKNSNKKYWNKFFNVCLEQNCSIESFVAAKGYDISYWLVKRVMDKFGKKQTLNLLKLRPGQHFNTSLRRYFKMNDSEFKLFLTTTKK